MAGTETNPIPVTAVRATEENNPDLFKTVEAGLAALREETADEVVEDASTEVADEVSPKGETEETTETASEEVAEEAGETGEAEAAEAGDGKTPTLPAAHRRSLLAYDWTEEEINTALAENPDGFRRTALRVHENRVKETSRWAELGRQTRDSDHDSDLEGEPTPPQQTAKSPITANGFPLIDTAKLKEKYGDDDMVDAIVGPVNETIAAFNKVLPDLTSAVQAIRSTQGEKLQATVDQFFGRNDLKTYETVYGKDTKSCTDEQFGNRNKVLEMADALIVGARKQGRVLSVEESMELAHDSVSSKFKEQAVREDLRGKAAKRSKSISLRPAKSGNRPDSKAAPKDRSELESRTRTRLAKVFTK